MSIETAPMPRRRWRIAWLLGFGVLVNYFDRVNLSVSYAALSTTFGISAVTFGYLSGAYNWTYAMCQLPIGVLLDKFGIRRIGRIGTFLWSVASFGAAITPNLGGFFGAGVAYEISPSYDIRLGYRGMVVKTPSFKLPSDAFNTGRYEVISLPTLGVAYHF